MRRPQPSTALRVTIFTVLAAGAVAAVPAAASQPKVVDVDGKTTLKIQPNDQYGGTTYSGQVSYTKVRVVQPPTASLTPEVKGKAQRACLSEFVNGADDDLRPAVQVFVDPNHTTANLGPRTGEFTANKHGEWELPASLGAPPGGWVYAEGGFWDQYYNYTGPANTRFDLNGHRVKATCHEFNVKKRYPT